MRSLLQAALDGPGGFVIRSLAGTVLATQTPAMVLRLLAATALLLAPYLLMGFWLGEHVSVHAAAGYAAVVLASLWLLAYLANTWRRFFLFHTPLFLASVVFIGYAIISAQLPGDPIAYVLVTSSWEEVYGFFGLGQEQRLLMLFIAGLALYLGLSLWLSPRATPAVGRTRFRTLAFGSLAALAATGARADKFDFFIGRIDEDTLVIALSAGRPHPLVVRALKLARHRNAKTAAITDATLSEVAKLAQTKLYYSSSTPAYVRSHTALLSLIQALAFAVYSRNSDQYDDRIKAFRLK